MKVDKSIIFLIVLAALILSYFMFFYCKVDFELKEEIIEVNIHDTVDLTYYIDKVTDNNNKNLAKKVKISVEGGELDEYKNGKLYIGDFSGKVVTYTLKYKFKTFTKTMEIIVISDPSNPNFHPNYDYKEEENKDDTPNKSVNTQLSDKQKKYLETLK